MAKEVGSKEVLFRKDKKKRTKKKEINMIETFK
jgi:hypothetical protein